MLVPAGQSGAPQAGCLLERYLSQKSGRASASQPGSKFKGRRSRCFSSLQLSPMGSHYPVFLEPPSSSSGSSCTPSPEWVGRRHTWSQSSRIPRPFSPSASNRGVEARHVGPKRPHVQGVEDAGPRPEISFTVTPPPPRSTLIKIPTYQDLNNLTPKLNYASAFNAAHASHQTPPTLPVTALSHGSSDSARSKPEQRPLLAPRASPAAHPGFFQAGFTAAFSSVAPLTSLSSLLSLAAPVRTSQAGESLLLSDRPPAEFCLSPDTSYESLSISHLQRRGEQAPPHTRQQRSFWDASLSARHDELFCSSAFAALKGLPPLKHDLFLTLSAWDWPGLPRLVRQPEQHRAGKKARR